MISRSERQKIWRKTHPDKYRLQRQVTNRKYQQKYPERERASRKITRFINKGVIRRLPCCVCGSTFDIQGHPLNYENLSEGILFFCDFHNKEYHKNNCKIVSVMST